jgi:hypothetical protein
MLLALLFSEAALSAAETSEYRDINDQLDPGGASVSVAAPVRGHAWSPRVDSWGEEKSECPIFFQREIQGFGVFRLGPRCAEHEDFPHAL